MSTVNPDNIDLIAATLANGMIRATSNHRMVVDLFSELRAELDKRFGPEAPAADEKESEAE